MRALRIAGVGVVVLVCGLGLVVGLPGCSSGPPEFKEPPVRVVVTTTMIADMVKRMFHILRMKEWKYSLI